MKTKQLKEIFTQLVFELDTPIIDTAICKIAYDSRKVIPGTLFVAIHGFSANGHDYLKEAVEKGAVAAVVEKKITGITIPQFVVKNSRKTLARIAANFYCPDIDEMTTNGKTTTSILIRSVMKTAGNQFGLIGTINYHVAQQVIKAWNTTPESVDLFDLLYTMHLSGQKGCVMERQLNR